MIYAAASVWLMVVVLLAWGVVHLWTTIIKPRTVDGILLPGTVIARLGQTVGLLITGATLAASPGGRGEDKDSSPQEANPQPKIPVIGPVVVGLLPMLALGVMLYLVVIGLGAPVLDKLPPEQIPAQLPSTSAAFWNQLRSLITLAESTLGAVRTADGVKWRIAVFAYLMICLTARLAPLPGNARGHVGAVVTLGVAGWLASTVVAGVPEMILRVWPMLSLTIGWLLLMMMVSLVARGAISSIQMLTRQT